MGKLDYEAMVARQASHALPGRPAQLPGTGKVYDFGAGVPDPVCFPIEGFVEAARSMLESTGRDLVFYPGPVGYVGLREVIAQKLQHYEGLAVDKDEILLTSGSMQAIQLVTEILVDPGDTVIVEDLSYMGTLSVLRRWKARLIGVGLDGEGMRTDHLEETLARLAAEGTRPKFIYAITNFQNPTGVTLSRRRRQEILRLAERYGVLVVEDDSYGDLRCEGDGVTSMYALDRAGLVARIGTFSKILGAGVRQGWIMAPEALLTHMKGVKLDGGTNALAGRIIAAYLKQHLVERIAEVRQVYRVKRDAMLQALADFLGQAAEWTHPEGGMFLWVRLPEGTDPERLVETAAAERVICVPGWRFTPDGQGARNYIRLCYAYPTPEDIREGVRLLARAIETAGGRLVQTVASRS